MLMVPPPHARKASDVFVNRAFPSASADPPLSSIRASIDRILNTFSIPP